MSLGEIGFLLALLVVYGGTIFGLFMGSRRIGVPSSVALVGGFTVFGILGGVAVALVWPSEGVVLVNPLGLLVGDEAYGFFINHPGDPPWLLGLPQVYVPASAVVWGFLGAVAQAIYNGVTHLMMDWRAAAWQAGVLGVLTGVCLIVVHLQEV